MWFVYDSEDQFIICETEEEARQLFLDKLDEYENDTSGSEWCDSVEDLMWGKSSKRFVSSRTTPFWMRITQMN